MRIAGPALYILARTLRPLPADALTPAVDQYLHELLGPPTLDLPARCNLPEQMHQLLESVVWATRQCGGMPYFVFNLELHTLKEWMALCGPVARMRR
jgi:hypothetical protein